MTSKIKELLTAFKEKIKEVIQRWNESGVKLPMIFDPTSGKLSVTLFFPYFSFILAFTSVVALHFKPALMPATIVAIIFWVLSTVLYMIRKINKAKIDFDDKSIDLESGPDLPLK